MITKIKDKIYLYLLFRKIALIEKKKLKIRKKYCAFGWHKLRIYQWSIKESGKRIKKVTFLKCYFCEYVFFASKKDKDKYLQMKNPKRNPLTKSSNTLKVVGSSEDSKKKSFYQTWDCPKCNLIQKTRRRKTSIGKSVKSYCINCKKDSKIKVEKN